MKSRLYIFLMCVCLSIPSIAYSTHIVGGSLTYVYNGGSSYTVTLKLYRDCGPNTAGFPNPVVINVEGYNGASFTPSKDISISLGAVSVVPPSLDPCAITPNPVPCVQQGIYTTTINNLPPNAGGYHLTFQQVARNVGLSNVNAACNCIGSSFYANIPGNSVIWAEDFTLANNTVVDNGATAWSIAAGPLPLPAPATARVNANLFEITGVNLAQETWTSQSIPISCPSINLSVDLSENGTLDANDSIFVYYRLNGGPLTLFSTNGFIRDDFTNAVATATGLAASTIQIVIRVHYDLSSPTSEIYRFDNVMVSCNDFEPNSNPVFNLFPPIFVCVGQPFTFNHAATDANGDSLVYSFYTPYNGDNAIGGPLDPTFPGNVASFTPIVWQPGYSATNPLGGAPLNLNSSTGLLTGTAGILGQFVVGVVVKEYRNGVYIGQTLRDFQFNVVNCPQPPPPFAGTDIIVNQGCTSTMTATGYTPATVTWNSVYPGALGAYNNYLSCTTGCLSPTATGQIGAPPYVDYQICGLSAACNSASVCDTVRVIFNFTLGVTIVPQNPTICLGQTSTMLTANGTGGTPPYSYLWNSVNPAQSILVGNGTYTVRVSDGSGCPPAFTSVTVTSYSVAISANAGPDQTICNQIPITTLSGSVAGASGGMWSGGGGTFSPNNITLSATYSPTAAELTAGVVNLLLTTTGNGSCPAAYDTVKINYVGFTGTVSLTSIPVSCFGGNNGSSTVSIAGGTPPYTYSWNTSPAQSAITAVNLAIGTYSVTIRNGIGCTSTNPVTITQPSPVQLASSITHISCSGQSTGAISITPSGGVGPYTYLWQPGNQTTSSITSKPVGTYTVTVTDFNSCQLTSPYTINQSPPIVITLTPTNVSCFNGSDGIATSTVSGGNAPYTYNWSSGATSPTATGLPAGTFSLTITDNLGCLLSNSVIIAQPTTVITNTTSTNETCNYLNNGTATAVSSGGTPGYTYLWQPGASTTISINNLSSGTYTLTTTDLKGCTAIAFATITEPALLAINFISQINVSCFARTDGTVTASPTGGTPNYTYLWSNGATTAQISNLSAQIYTATVTDSKGCVSTNPVTITQPTVLTTSTTTTNETCSYSNNGTAASASSGGTAGYTYLWQPGLQTTGTVSNLSAGTYTLTVTDSNGCTAIANPTISEPAAIVISFTAQTNVSCFAGNNGAVTASPSGGTSGYTYLWASGGTTTASKTNLTAGTYFVTITDAQGCTATNSVVITQPLLLSASTSTTNETCNYLNNGTATAIPAGGTAGYTYLWQPGALTTISINNLSSGTYTLTVTDAKGCIATTNAIIAEPAPLTIAFTAQINVSCFGGSDGTVTASPTGGTPNYTYLWASGGATTASVNNLTAGTYSVTVSDNLGCVGSNSAVITQPIPLVANTITTNETCNYLNNGTATAVPSGGTAGYTYLWQPGLQTTGTISNLSSGTYTLSVTDSKGCIATANAIITEPAPIVISFTAQTNVSCFAGNDGAVTASPSGGTSGYTYLWASGGTTTASKTNLTAGTYFVTITDAQGCTATNSVVITQPLLLSASTSTTNETCNYLNNGTATAIPAGGTAGYTYLWQPGALTTISINNLSSGTYTLTVTDAKGCIATTNAIIAEPAPLTIAFTAQINVSCFGGSDGTVTASPTGGTPNYTYLWASGGATTASVSNLTAGSYIVTVTDNLGCVGTNSAVITQPTIVLASTSSTNETCNYLNNGTATAISSGGTAGYTYLWQPSLQTTGTISNLSSGTYTLSVTDSKGCIATANAIITEPAPIVISFTAQTNVSCFGGNDGAVTASPSGGTSGYTYLWASGGTTTASKTNLSAGTYFVTITDAQGCTATNSVVITQPLLLSASTSTTNETCNYLNNGTATAIPAGGTAGYTYLWQPGGLTTISINNLSSGTYTLTVTDAKGCIATTNAIIAEPAPLTIAFTAQINVSCFGGSDGSVTASPIGGTPNYTYLWASGAVTTASVSNLTAGTYSVTVTDNLGCVGTNSAVITQPTIVLASTSSTNETCNYLNNGTATAISSGGTAGYTYLWQPGLQTTGTISNLSSGTYTLSVTDSKGCIATANAIITQPAPIVISFIAQTNVSCFGGSNGTVTASPSGGTSGYTYLWASGGTTTASKTNLSAGTYFVTITDAQGCTATNSVVITQPSLLSASTSKVNETCNYLNNGTATAIPAGGTAGYTYLWQPGALTTISINNLSSGTYTLTVTDTKGCTATANAIITEPAPLAINFTAQINVSCFGGNNGSVLANTTGGTPNYTYLWAPGGGTTASKTNLAAGTYTVTSTDSRGCIVVNSVTITQPLAPLSVSASSLPVSCFGGSNGSVSAVAANGTSAYTYGWMPGSLSGQSIPNLTAGTYTVTATDSKGCTSTNSVTVIQPVKITLTTSSTNSDCGQPNGVSTVTVSGGNAPYSYFWSPSGGTNASADSLVAGAYTVIVTDFTGCISTQFGNVNENTAPVATIFSVVNVKCFGGSTGSAKVGTSGGIGPFTYSWLPTGGTDSTAVGLTAGTYTVTVTGANGCKSLATTSPDILQPPPILITITKSTVSCFGGNDGTASVVASGGTPGYTYQWIPGGNTGLSVNGLLATTYTMEVTDSNSCVQTMPFTIAQPAAPLSASLSFTPNSCFGGADGSVSATAAGGTAPYNYNWMPGNFNGSTLSNLSSGSYTLTVTDIKGCNHTDSITITQPTPVVLTTDSTNSNCSLANGQASVVVSGGSGGYLYQWSPSGGTNATATALLSGGYSVTVTDGNGCISTKGITVNDNASPVATVTSTTNVSCNTGSNGTATVSVVGGAGPFTYSWLPSGGTNITATGLVPGTYTVTVTDINLCQSIPAVSPAITQPSPILITVTKTNVSCFGGTNGTASAIASGGTSGYTYQWLPSGTMGASITNLSANTYTMQVTDANSCVQTEPFTITQPSAALSASLSFLPVSCFGGTDGSVSAVAAGGTAPYNYSWMPGNGNGPVFSNVATGTYTVSITDLKGCTFSNFISVSQPTVVVLTTDSINSNCSLANGQASVVVSGGSGGYLYQWSPSGGTNATATALLSGGYSIRVTDGNGCISTKGITVNDNASPVATVTATTNVSCNTGSNGTATVSVAGGAGPFTYSWLPSGGTNITATGLVPGTYTVTVTDINLCQSIPAVSPVITQPSPILITVTKTNVSCFGGTNGTASAIASGGTSGYTYQWLPSGTMGASITNLSANTYTMQVTDANSCVQTEPFTITQPSAALSASLSFLPVSCFGGTDGSVSATAAGGTAPYNYSWMPGNGNGPVFSNVATGTYTVSITDLKGCTFSNFISVSQPTVVVLTTDSINSNCSLANGQASVLASGGAGTYLYQWSPSGGTNATATALLSGGYIVTVTDGNGCISTKGITVNDNASPVATVTSTTNVSCNTGSNGTATVSVVGGAGPFTYSWLPSGGTNLTATGLVPGTYTVTVTDINLCQSIPAVSPVITQPSPILITVTKTNVSCFGGTNGTASAIASGGTSGYTYQWLPGGTMGASISNLSANTYTVQVTDANLCVQTQAFTITQPSAALSASLSFNPVSCFGGATGTVSSLASGGTGPYNYSWMPGNYNGPNLANLTVGTYTLTATDSKGCAIIDSITVTQPTIVILTTNSVNSNCSLANGQASVAVSGGTGSYLYQWSPSGGTNATATTLLSGPYTVTVTDGNGCISTKGITVNDNASPVATVTATTNVSCNTGSNGTATVSVSGGAGPFTYSWLPSGGTNLTATGLVPGTYTVTVTDINLCQSIPAVSPVITEPNPILISVTKNNVSCFAGSNGTASAIASGGTSGYSYQWQPSGIVGTTLINLIASTYTIEVTDSKSCIKTLPVIITEPNQLTSIISSSSNVTCTGLNNGNATVTASGGSLTYNYNWLPSGGNGPTATGLVSGTYTVTVTDFKSCNTSSSVIITEPSQALSAISTGSSTSCFGGSNGTASINTNGGTPSYSYLWNPAVSTNDTAFGLSPGNYTILVTDNNNCQVNKSVSIAQPPAINGNLAYVNPSCGLSNGSVSSQLSGGVFPYTYLWSWGSSTTTGINNLAPGTYSLQITDSLNCILSLSANLINIPSPVVAVSSINNVSCYGGNNGSTTINIIQGTAPYAINWTPSGGNSLTASSLSIGTYTVNVTDAIGCQTSDIITIAEPTPIDVSISSINNVLCNGGNTGSISVSPSGGTGPLYTYSWTPNSSSTATASNLTTGTYTVNVKDQNNCTKSISTSITQPTALSSSTGFVMNPSCYGSTGSASVVAAGGVLPYSYSWSAPAVGQTGSTANDLIAGSYTVTVTDTNGCIATSNVLLTQPQKLLTTAGGNDTICLGQSGTVTASASGGTGSYYFVWQPSGINNAGTLGITPTSNTTYTVVAYDQIGCAGTPSTVSAIVYTLTGANVQAIATSPICPGQISAIYVETSGTTGPLTYQWNNNLGTGPGVYLATPGQPTTYIVTVSNVCGLSVTDSVDVLFNPQPTVVVTAGPTALCALGGVQFNDISITGNINDPITSWYWNFGDGTSSTEQNPYHYFDQSGTFFATLTVNTDGGCVSNNGITPLTITSYPAPIAAFAVNSSDLLIPYDVLECDNQSVGASSYVWSFGEGGTSTAVDPQYVYTLSGTFQVQLIATSQHGCLDTAYMDVITNANVIFPNVFTPDPNGSSGGTYTLFDLSNDVFFPYTYGVVEYKLEMFNRWGEEIFESLDIKTGWDGYYRGEICQQDVYVWKAYIKLNNGKIYNLSGDLTLLRY